MTLEVALGDVPRRNPRARSVAGAEQDVEVFMYLQVGETGLPPG